MSEEIKIQQEVTTRCTQDCGFCPRQVIGQHRELGDITPEMANLVLKRYAEIEEPLDVSISGFGEPLLWPGIFDFIDELKDFGITVEMNTNATELTGWAGKLLIGQLDRMQVSINVPNAEMFKRHKNSDTYEKVRDNLEQFFKLKGDSKPVTDLRFLKFPETEPLIPQAMKEWGRMLPKGDAIIVAEFENWMGAIDEHYFGITYDRTPPEHSVIICNDLFGKYLTITKEGNTYACCFAVALPEIYPTNLGNIKNHSIKDLLNSPNRIKQFNAQRKGKYLNQCDICSKIRVADPHTRYTNPDEFYDQK